MLEWVLYRPLCYINVTAEHHWYPLSHIYYKPYIVVNREFKLTTKLKLCFSPIESSNYKLFLYSFSWIDTNFECTTLFVKAWTQVLHWFKSYLRRVEDLRWWESLTEVPTGDKTNRYSLVNHTAKTIHHHLHNQRQ